MSVDQYNVANAAPQPPRTNPPPSEATMETELKRIRLILTAILIVLLLNTSFPLSGALAGDATKIENSRFEPLYVEVVNGASKKIPVTIE
jgi:hypothetical protein